MQMHFCDDHANPCIMCDDPAYRWILCGMPCHIVCLWWHRMPIFLFVLCMYSILLLMILHAIFLFVMTMHAKVFICDVHVIFFLCVGMPVILFMICTVCCALALKIIHNIACVCLLVPIASLCIWVFVHEYFAPVRLTVFLFRKWQFKYGVIHDQFSHGKENWIMNCSVHHFH